MFIRRGDLLLVSAIDARSIAVCVCAAVFANGRIGTVGASADDLERNDGASVRVQGPGCGQWYGHIATSFAVIMLMECVSGVAGMRESLDEAADAWVDDDDDAKTQEIKLTPATTPGAAETPATIPDGGDATAEVARGSPGPAATAGGGSVASRNRRGTLGVTRVIQNASNRSGAWAALRFVGCVCTARFSSQDTSSSSVDACCIV